MIIALCGFMGAGKTGVGKALAADLARKGRNFALIDLDTYIEEKHGCSVTELFAKRGEEYFRDEEYAALVEVTGTGGDLILSLGGGTPTFGRCNKVIRERTRCIYLTCTAGELAYRLVGTARKRPVLAKAMLGEGQCGTGGGKLTRERKQKNLEKWIEGKLAERSPWYAACSVAEVESTVWDKPAIVSEILRCLGEI